MRSKERQLGRDVNDGLPPEKRGQSQHCKGM